MAQSTQTILLEIVFPDSRSKDIDRTVKRFEQELHRKGVRVDTFHLSDDRRSAALTQKALSRGIASSRVPDEASANNGVPDLTKYAVRCARDKVLERDPAFQAQRRADFDAWFNSTKPKP